MKNKVKDTLSLIIKITLATIIASLLVYGLLEIGGRTHGAIARSEEYNININ